MTLSTELVESHMNTFVGYGNPAARFWYIGMEEGGNSEAGFVNKRLNAWHTRGRATFEDLMEYHRSIDLYSFFDPPRKLQTTWKQLIRITLVAEGRPFDTEAIREYQALRLGRRDGETALLELFSLPAPRLAHWPYAELSDLPVLRSRKVYRQSVARTRVGLIQKLIDQHEPEFVVMYGTSYRKYWDWLSEGPFRRDGNLLRGQRGRTEMILIKHPTARGTSNTYFEEVGRLLGDRGEGARQG